MKKKENLIIALLIIILMWLGVLSWTVFNQDKKNELNEFYFREIFKNF
jgi:predicted negative regulator of RcsB-dependent stress response